jgi:hypothetical protein
MEGGLNTPAIELCDSPFYRLRKLQPYSSGEFYGVWALMGSLRGGKSRKQAFVTQCNGSRSGHDSERCFIWAAVSCPCLYSGGFSGRTHSSPKPPCCRSCSRAPYCRCHCFQAGCNHLHWGRSPHPSPPPNPPGHPPPHCGSSQRLATMAGDLVV